jgi:two-component system, cell cycle response regulator
MPARILIIEDNPENLDLMSYLLTAFGHTVLKAVDGEEGVEVALRSKPDLILCDLQLPKLDGFEVAKQISDDAELSRTPIVAVTAYAMRGDRDRATASGFKGYITKPIVPEEFVSRTEEFLKTDLRSNLRPAGNATVPAKSAPRPSGTRAFILALDDRAVNLSLLRSVLEPSGYRVDTVDTVQKALTRARAERPDLILSDLHLPEVGGYEFLEAVKREPDLKNVPFILMSSTASDETALAQGLALGANVVLFRPLEPEVLLRQVESCLGERKGIPSPDQSHDSLAADSIIEESK